jgi:hypothetical protein
MIPVDLAILKEQERLISGLNPPHPIIFRNNHASNALALAGDNGTLATISHASFIFTMTR